ncbi:MAG: phosphoribosyltransferase family protein [bacterium]|nr:phosphoribosyltransferase family protein [bacterium]
MWRIFSALLDALVPEHDDVLRARSLSEKDIASLVHPRAAGASWISALLPYRDARVRALIRAIKYRGETALLEPIGVILGDYILEVIAEKRLLSGWERPLLIPISSSPERLRKRDYTQAERIARATLTRLSGEATFAPGVLLREERKSQVSVERRRRLENMRGAFSVPHPETVSGRFVILIDDVVESGATLEDARRALLSAGAKEVIAVALAQ